MKVHVLAAFEGVSQLVGVSCILALKHLVCRRWAIAGVINVLIERVRAFCGPEIDGRQLEWSKGRLHPLCNGLLILLCSLFSTAVCNELKYRRLIPTVKQGRYHPA